MTRVFTIMIVAVLSLLLASCGSRGTVTTKDDSVEYKTARKLPPLKKPSKVIIPQSAPSTGVQDRDVAVVKRTNSGDGVVTQSADTATPLSDSSIGSVTADSATTDSVSNGSVSTGSVSTGSVASADTSSIVRSDSEVIDSFSGISTEITTLKNNTARLKVASDFEDSWEYLAAKLARSTVTVFARNKAARRFSIGCAAFDAPESDDSGGGGWAIFKRNRTVSDEYCALSVSESRGNTIVSALDRDGDEVGKNGATLVFKQLINN